MRGAGLGSGAVGEGTWRLAAGRSRVPGVGQPGHPLPRLAGGGGAHQLEPEVVLALTGPPASTRALALALVCELVAFHAPDDL
ncbi:MAG TPA: hypothetical protein VHA34_04900, partial [Actinomycetes bacterium]|nr:hypothetical protein [Actinomycetes bacterium]